MFVFHSDANTGDRTKITMCQMVSRMHASDVYLLNKTNRSRTRERAKQNNKTHFNNITVDSGVVAHSVCAPESQQE